MTQFQSLSRGWTLQEATQRLHSLTVAEIKEHLIPHVWAFVANEKAWLAKQEKRVAEVGLQASLLSKSKKQRKDDLVFQASTPFLTPECFERFRKHLPKEANLILETVLLDGVITSEDIIQKYGIKSATKSKVNSWSYLQRYKAEPGFKLYMIAKRSTYSYRDDEEWATFYWPSALREMALPLLFPEQPPLKVEPPAPHSDVRVFQGEAVVQEELPGLLIRLKQKPLKMTQRGRPSLPSVRSIGKKLKVQEFFPETEDKRIEALRVRCLVGLLSQFPTLPSAVSPKDIKALFHKGFTAKFDPPIHLLTYLKGIDRISSSWGQRQGTRYRKVMDTLPEGQWVQYDSLIDSLKTQGYTMDTDQVNGISDLSQQDVDAPKDEYGYAKEVRVYPHFDERLFSWPVFHAMTFAFAAWGLLDIAYYGADEFPLRYAVDSPLNRIVAIRVTALGAYVLGNAASYQSTVKPPFTLELATDSLSILLVDGDQDRAATAIRSFARPLGQQRFYSNANLFLDDCKSSQELTRKINLFKSIFPGDLPANWTTFFEEMSQQVNPLQKASGYSVFRLNPDNKPLLQLIARDPVLKSLSLKAEEYLLLIKGRELNKFKSRLQELGYLLE